MHGSGFESWDTPGLPACLGLCEDGRAIVGIDRSIYLWNWGGLFEKLAEVEADKPGNQLNEGAIGPDGAFWAGTMENNVTADGAPKDISGKKGRLYRVLPDSTVQKVSDDPFGVTNTLVWPDDRTLITVDTTENNVYKYEILQNGQLSSRQECLSGFQRGIPDGSCLEVQSSQILNCRVTGSCLIRFSLAGHVNLITNLPVEMPTSCCFGGPSLETLFVTSSTFGKLESELNATADGQVLAIEGLGQGRPAYRFAPP